MFFNIISAININSLTTGVRRNSVVETLLHPTICGFRIMQLMDSIKKPNSIMFRFRFFQFSVLLNKLFLGFMISLPGYMLGLAVRKIKPRSEERRVGKECRSR